MSLPSRTIQTAAPNDTEQGEIMPLGKGTLPGQYPAIQSKTGLDVIIDALSNIPEPQPLQISASVASPTEAQAQPVVRRSTLGSAESHPTE